MNNRHLTSFKVENFKRFASFEMTNLGMFNLILGDNNVGKTSVLEALLVCDNSWELFNRLLVALDYRKLKSSYEYEDIRQYVHRSNAEQETSSKINFIQSQSNGVSSHISIEFDSYRGRVSVKGIPGDSTEYPLVSNVSPSRNSSTPFIPFYKGHDEDLTRFYSRIQSNRSAKKAFVKSLATFVPDIEDIELSSPFPGQVPHLIVSQKQMDATIPLALFGDGTLKLFRLLAEISINKGRRLMIDEVDTGIHFTRYKDFWKIVLQSAFENEVQLFMTTHNIECIRFFKEVLEVELQKFQDESRCISLVENSVTKQVSAHTFSFTEFEHAINVGNEIRI